MTLPRTGRAARGVRDVGLDRRAIVLLAVRATILCGHSRFKQAPPTLPDLSRGPAYPPLFASLGFAPFMHLIHTGRFQGRAGRMEPDLRPNFAAADRARFRALSKIGNPDGEDSLQPRARRDGLCACAATLGEAQSR